MAAVGSTAGTRRDGVTGHLRTVKEDVTVVDTGDTWTPGLAVIEFFTFTPTAGTTATQWGATWTSPATRQGVVTFSIESGQLAGTVMAWGV